MYIWMYIYICISIHIHTYIYIYVYMCVYTLNPQPETLHPNLDIYTDCHGDIAKAEKNIETSTRFKMLGLGFMYRVI